MLMCTEVFLVDHFKYDLTKKNINDSVYCCTSTSSLAEPSPVNPPLRPALHFYELC